MLHQSLEIYFMLWPWTFSDTAVNLSWQNWTNCPAVAITIFLLKTANAVTYIIAVTGFKEFWIISEVSSTGDVVSLVLGRAAIREFMHHVQILLLFLLDGDCIIFKTKFACGILPINTWYSNNGMLNEMIVFCYIICHHRVDYYCILVKSVDCISSRYTHW